MSYLRVSVTDRCDPRCTYCMAKRMAFLPREELLALYALYPNLQTVQWVQEEPRNMGGWSFITRRVDRLIPESAPIGYIGRPARASVSEGYPHTHQLEQQRVLDDALAGREMTFP